MSTNDAQEVDELKLAWRALERRIERTQALEFARFRSEGLPRVRRALLPLAAGQLVQAALGALMVVWFALLWVEHRAAPPLVALGVVGQIWSAVLVALAVRQLIALSLVDYAAPVVAIQKQIAEVRERRLRTEPFLIISGCAMWLPVTLVVFARLSGSERWLEVPWLAARFAWLEHPQALIWLLANLALVPLLAWAVLRWLRSARRPALASRVDDELAGRALGRAQSMLAEIAEFERE